MHSVCWFMLYSIYQPYYYQRAADPVLLSWTCFVCSPAESPDSSLLIYDPVLFSVRPSQVSVRFLLCRCLNVNIQDCSSAVSCSCPVSCNLYPVRPRRTIRILRLRCTRFVSSVCSCILYPFCSCYLFTLFCSCYPVILSPRVAVKKKLPKKLSKKN